MNPGFTHSIHAGYPTEGSTVTSEYFNLLGTPSDKLDFWEIIYSYTWRRLWFGFLHNYSNCDPITLKVRSVDLQVKAGKFDDFAIFHLQLHLPWWHERSSGKVTHRIVFNRLNHKGSLKRKVMRKYLCHNRHDVIPYSQQVQVLNSQFTIRESW